MQEGDGGVRGGGVMRFFCSLVLLIGGIGDGVLGHFGHYQYESTMIF